MVPGFMQLAQDDQIALLKSGSYGIMLLYATQSYIPERNCFAYNQQLLNVDTLLTAALQQQHQLIDDDEKYFIQENLDFIRQLKQFNLSQTETAILSAIILFNAENSNLKDSKSVMYTNQRFVELLRMDIDNNRAQTTSISSIEKEQLIQQLLNLVNVNVRRLNQSHFELIKTFKIKNSQIEFPPLHRELFNVDYFVYYHQQQQQQQQVQLQQQQQQQHQQHHQQHHHQVQHLSMVPQTNCYQQQQQQQHPQHMNSNYNLPIVATKQNENLSMSSPSPSSCSSTSSSSISSSSNSTNNNQILSLSPTKTEFGVQQQAVAYDQAYYYSNSNGTSHQRYPVVGSTGVTQPVVVSQPSNSSPSSTSSSSSTLDFSHNLDDVMCPSMSNVTSSLNKVNSISLQANISSPSSASSSTSNSSSSSSISPPSYVSLTSAYALIKSEPMFSNSNVMSIGIDTV
jgi:hypothetical protein